MSCFFKCFQGVSVVFETVEQLKKNRYRRKFCVLKLVLLPFKCCVCRNKPALVMKMFRFRFCYFLTENYLKKVGIKLSNTRRISTLSPAAYPVLGKVTSLPLENLRPGNGRAETASNLRFSVSGKYWQTFLTSDKTDIIWDECLAAPEVPKEKHINTYAVIFLVCQQKKFYNCAISLFKYLWDKREITAGLLYLFCNMMLECPGVFKCCEDMIYKIFLSVINTDKTSVKTCATVLLQSSKYSKIVYDCYKDCMTTEKYHVPVIKSLLETKKINEALELYTLNRSRLFWIEKMFLEYFLQQTSEGHAPVPEICRFLSYLPVISEDITLSEENTKILTALFKKLRALDKNYFWMVNKGEVSPSCSFCKGKLELADVTQEEIKLLLKDLEEKVIIQDNIFIKSNRKEWDKFCNFIEKQDYSLVMDGLNIKYATNDYTKFEAVISKITNAGITPLVLGRSHFQRCPEFQLVRKTFPVFLTDNLSDDDVFVLYAALRKGKGCYTLSNDKMTFCNTMLSSEKYLNIYKRWQATHQCKLSFWKSLLFPPYVLNGIQKCADDKEGEFRYHYVSSQSMSPANMTCVSRIRKDREVKF